MKNGDNFLSVKQAAGLLGIHPKTLSLWAKKPPQRGGPPKRKFSARCIRFPKQQFLIWAGLAPPENKNV